MQEVANYSSATQIINNKMTQAMRRRAVIIFAT